MKPTDQHFGAEWAILESLCLGVDNDSERQLVDALLSREDLNWGDLLEQALRHQMLPMLAHAVINSHLEPRPAFYLEDHLQSQLDLNRRRLEVFRSATAQLCRELSSRGVAFAATKGITLESTIYQGLGVRRLKDVDFMIEPGGREAATAVLEHLGYRPGNFDRRSGEVAPHPRRDQMRYVLHPDHLPRYVRLNDDPCIRYVYVDFANSLTWNKAPYDIPVATALASTYEQPIPGHEGVALPRFDATYQFLFTVLHLFREAWLENWMEYGIDVSLMKFGDVIRLFAHDRDALVGEAFKDTMEAHGVVEPVLWVLEHLDRTFATTMVADLSMQGRVDDEWLNRAHPSAGRPRQWAGTMRERLHSKRRRELFEEPDEQL